MQISITKFTLMLMGWLALFSVAVSDARQETLAFWDGSDVKTSTEARKRWESLSPEEQARLRKRFERLQSLDETERSELVKRGKKLEKQSARLLEELSPEHRERLMSVPKRKRQQLIAEMVEAQRRDRGERIEAMLPEKTRTWLLDAPPKERRKRLERFRQQTRERISSRAVEDLAKALGYGEEEVQRLERLPLADRMKTVMNLRRKLDEREHQAGSFLGGFTKEMWSELEALPPDEYFTRVFRMRHEGGLRHLSPFGREERQDRREARSRERDLSRDLRRNLRVSPEDLVNLSKLSPEDREQELIKRRRAGVMETLLKFEAIAEDQAESWKACSNEEFFRRARALANGWTGSGRKERGGEPREASEEQ